jgi:Tfp pilus assembly protein FimT
MTLLEVLVTLVIIALVTAVASLAPRRTEGERSAMRGMLDDSLAAAIAQARHITLSMRLGDRTISATVHPDGGIVADSEFLAATDSVTHESR